MLDKIADWCRRYGGIVGSLVSFVGGFLIGYGFSNFNEYKPYYIFVAGGGILLLYCGLRYLFRGWSKREVG